MKKDYCTSWGDGSWLSRGNFGLLLHREEGKKDYVRHAGYPLIHTYFKSQKLKQLIAGRIANGLDPSGMKAWITRSTRQGLVKVLVEDRGNMQRIMGVGSYKYFIWPHEQVAARRTVLSISSNFDMNILTFTITFLLFYHVTEDMARIVNLRSLNLRSHYLHHRTSKAWRELWAVLCTPRIHILKS